jgi:hypothetical protein
MRDGSVLGERTAVAGIAFGKVQPLITDGGASTLLGLDGRTAGVTVGADPDRAQVWVHGSYWYQGEYAYAPHPDGTRVTYRIRNISGHPDFLIRLWQRRTLRTQQRDVDAYAATLAGRIG